MKGRINAVEIPSVHITSMCGVSLKDRCRDNDVREWGGLEEDLVIRAQKALNAFAVNPNQIIVTDLDFGSGHGFEFKSCPILGFHPGPVFNCYPFFNKSSVSFSEVRVQQQYVKRTSCVGDYLEARRSALTTPVSNLTEGCLSDRSLRSAFVKRQTDTQILSPVSGV
ncbi:hypothetical protein EVAR_9237_1 [Eumeta japonica]|uniref:Uncharacterized protein n=1 Tax=Eumeta variegata TaxID=151549 RepID=A0A4C1TMH7_EUMVA|nr:hypothetical protein EVAR_9237_1 [Eumeta japonica]